MRLTNAGTPFPKSQIANLKYQIFLVLTGLLCGVLSWCPAFAQDASSADGHDSAPFISAIADQTVDEDSATIPLRVLYGDAQTPVAELRLVAISSNEKLLPPQNVLFNEATRQEMVVVPAHNQNGASTVTLTVENAQGKRSTRSFRVSVKPVNDPPRIVAEGTVTLLEDDKPLTISMQVTDPESPAEELAVAATTPDMALIPLRNLKLEGTGSERTLTVLPAPDQHGLATVVLTVTDPQGAQSRLEIGVRVRPVNDPPRLSGILDQRLFANQDLGPIQFALTDDETPAAELVLEGVSSNPLLVPEISILFGGAGEQRTLSVRPAKNLTGSALITVKARDRERLESSSSFLLTVDRENAPPEIVGLSNLTIDQDQTAGPLAFVVTDPDGSAETVHVAAASSTPGLISGLQLNGAGAERSLVVVPRAGASGVAEITLTATDSAGGRTHASFVLNVRPAALRPKALALSFSTPEDTPVEILLQAESPSERPLVFAIVSAPQKGTLTGTPPRLLYTPNPNASGSDTFQFQAGDGTLESLPATVSITIQEVNDPPAISSIASRRTEPGKTAGPIRFAVEDLETVASKLAVTGRSSDPDLIPSILLTGQDSVREVTIVPAPGRTGSAMITLVVQDGGGSSASTAFELTVAETSGAPKAEPQSLMTPEDVPVAIALRGRDAGGQTINFAIVDAPTKGTLSGFAPNLVYRPKPNETGEDRFTFKASNAAGESPAAAVEILILAVNDSPVARSQSPTVNEDTALAIELTATDADKDPLSFEITSFPTKGKLSGSPPRLTYTPNANETGIDQFTFTAGDGELVSAPATIRLTIEPVNDPPTATGFFVSSLEDTVIPISLKARDTDGDPLIYSIPILPAKGMLAGSPPDLTYIPNPNTTGLDRFTFRVSDGSLSSEAAVVSVMVLPVNDAPVAQNQFLSLAEDGGVEVLLSARDADDDPLSYLIVSAPAKGSISGTAPRLTYRPEANAHGLDSFTFKVTDGTTESLPATITLSIRSINDPPVAHDQFVALSEDSNQGILLSAHDADGGGLSYQIVEPPKNGLVEGVPPNLIYTPARDFHGEDRFTFKASDGDLESALATVRVSVRPVNDAPVATGQFLTVTEGRSRLITLAGRDAEGSPLQFILASLPAKGVLSGQPPNLVYLPHPTERGLDSFTFKVSDGTLESPTVTVQMALAEKTSGPSISTIADQTSRNGEATAKLPFTIGDLETPPDKLVIAASSSAPAIVPSGNIVLEGAGEARTVHVTPTGAKPGTATITMVVWDEDGLAASAQFAVTIVIENRAPVAEPLSLTTSEGQPLPIELKASDPERDPLTFTVTAPPKQGRLSGAPPRMVYTPEPGAAGTDTFAFKVRDTASESAEAMVTIQILALAPNQSPVIELVVPGDMTIVDPATPLVVEANAIDPDGAIQQVDFYAGATRIGSSSAAPYRITWSAPSKGPHVLRAKVIDDRAGETTSAPINIRVDALAGRVTVLTGGDDPDLALIRRYLFEVAVQGCQISRAEAKLETLLGQSQAVLWHQPAATDVQPQDLSLLEALARTGTPLYFLGDSLLAAGRGLSQGERDRWQRLVHIKPGGASWLKHVTILEEVDHPVVRNGPAGTVARFAYPVTVQQSGLQTGSPGEVVLGRSGAFDLLLAAVDAQSSARAFTHHLRLSGASDDFGMAEQSKLFKNAIAWLLNARASDDRSLEVSPPTATVVLLPPSAFPRLVIRRENPDTIRLEMLGAGADSNYALEASDDLVHWSRLNTGFTSPATSATFSPVTAPRRFFRAVVNDTPIASSPPAPR